MSLQLEQLAQRLARIGVVLDDQDIAPCRRRLRRRGALRRRPRLDRREAHGEGAAAPGAIAAGGGRAAVQRGELAHQRQPKPEAARRAIEPRLALHEWLEDAREQLAAHADAVVGDAQHRVAAFVAHRDRDRAVDRRVLDRVDHQVGDDLLEARGVGLQPRRLQILDDAMLTEPAAAAQRGERLRGRRGKVEGAQLEDNFAHDGAAGVEKVVGEAREVLGLPADDAARARRVFGADAGMIEQARRVHDRAERVAQLVAEQGEELVLGAVGGLGRGARLLLALEQRLSLGLAARALVGRHLQRVGDLADLADVGLRRRDRLAAAERLRRRAQSRHRRADAARDVERGEDAEHDRQHDAAAVDGREAQRAAFNRSRRDSGRDRPAVAQAMVSGIDAVAFQRAGLAKSLGGRARHQCLQAGRRHAAQVLGVDAGTGDALIGRVEYRDHPVLRRALAHHHVEDRLRSDHRAQHVAQLAVARHRDAHREIHASLGSFGEIADHRRTGLDDLLDALRLDHPGHAAAEFRPRVDERLAGGVREVDRRPVGLRGEHTPGALVEAAQVAAIERGRRAQGLQHVDRAVELRIDARGERPRQLDRRSRAQRALLVDERQQRDAGHDRERQDGRCGENEKAATQRLHG